MKRTLKNYSLMIGLAGMAAALVLPEAQVQSASEFSVDDNFRTGWHEATIGTAVLFANIIRGNNRPNDDYAMGYAQFGYMITQPSGDGIFRGSLEVAPEIFGAGIFHGPGNYIWGGTLWLRYNFVPKGWRLVPYLEGGAGLTDLDIPHIYDGKDFNFNLEAAVGVHYFIKPRCALNLEYRLQHISNADIWDKNIGLNASGPSVGISFYF